MDQNGSSAAQECAAWAVVVDENHRWLHQFVGEWESTMNADMGPDKPAETHHGSETVRKLGELWIVGDGRGSMPDGTEAQMQLTLGYDPAKGRFVGSWVGSMMAMQWVYEGELDGARKVLTLNCQGPSMSPEPSQGGGPKMANYRDVYEIVSDNERTLTSFSQTPDGQWVQFMKATYRRK